SGSVAAELWAEAAGDQSAACSRDGRLVLFGGGDGVLRAYALDAAGAGAGGLVATGPARLAWTGKAAGLADQVYCLAATPDGRVVLGGYDYGTIRAWDADTGRLLCTLPRRHADDRGVTALAVSPDGRLAVSG